MLIFNDEYQTILSFISVFNIGIFLAFYYNKQLSFLWLFVYILVSSLLILKLNGPVILSFTLPVFVIIFFSIKLNNKALNFLGKISYSLYLIHTVTAFSIINLAHRFPKTGLYQFSFTVLAVVVTLVASYLMYLTIEKPTMRWSKKITYDRS